VSFVRQSAEASSKVTLEATHERPLRTPIVIVVSPRSLDRRRLAGVAESGQGTVRVVAIGNSHIAFSSRKPRTCIVTLECYEVRQTS
jgi:hypothetical protein